MTNRHKYKIVLVEPSAIVARGIESMVSSMAEMEIVETVDDLSRLTETRWRRIAPDIVLLDPSVLSRAVRLSLRSSLPHLSEYTLVAVIGNMCDSEAAVHQYDGHISLYDSSDTVEKKLLAAIEHTENTGRNEHYNLSSREREVLIHVAKGLTNKEIADRMNLSTYTVVTHRKNISRKLGIRSISGLTVYAIMNKLIDPTDL